ncbi:dCTP deaminase [Pseudomonas sp. SWRI154]|uniref:dCTP deaminase n=1 Tax=Pseudomonas sp. SWRI154 TaxID=2745501 RepID=UPI001644290F|nr:dCTP deaminase [Pseudomonas sp. SWRI154]MBC3365820.1 dCTP deaminase [Pseudomonas sp. SWRI154]
MILTGNKIRDEVGAGKIIVEPFSESQLSTNSYDLRLGYKYLKYKDGVIDPKKRHAYHIHDIPKDGLQLEAGDFLLSESLEVIGSNHFVPIIHAKSGTARAGLFVHITADLIDIGSIGKVTFQLYATLPLKIYQEMLLAQVSFWRPEGAITLYKGKYQNSTGPQPSKTYLDYV